MMRSSSVSVVAAHSSESRNTVRDARRLCENSTILIVRFPRIVRNVKRKRRRVTNLAGPLSATLSVCNLSLIIFLVFTYNASLRLYFQG